MSEPKDPEQLLADALRAQAVFAPSASPARDPEPATDAVPTSAINELPSAYGLLSGASADSLERERAALDPVSEAPTAYTPAPPPPRGSAQLPAYWILLLAVLLGLAAGSVVGLLTLV
ncbi:hypothetical protein [Amycolatopsis sp. SID8362]|uniref:hypothetical protein n=1 Tax=Amycolatopsis sp. SID8362 TaxID=2690346 RepID=UPI00136A05C1|nr:hypothetical protein [Amycolatopsis sp. SID8362]NBH01644.1 hypothetical protein [Amycolatopsis sp. SID8362]NED38345.1 hypothetical protein [Amycolatopsis sp. SID8362]